MWIDIQKKKQRAYKSRFYASETYGLYSIGEEFYELEKELIKGRFKYSYIKILRVEEVEE